MSSASVLSYAQRVAQKASPCWADDAIPTDNNRDSSLVAHYSTRVASRLYDSASILDDSDSSSQTSSQTSSNEDGDGTYSSPPTSVSSDGESVCGDHVAVIAQKSSPYLSRDYQPAGHHNAAPYQEIHNVAIRPKNVYSTQNTVSTRSSQDGSCISSTQSVDNDHQLSTDRFESRRRRRSVGDATCPPKLRRDTDNTEAIVKMIVVFCTNLINSIWCPRGFDDPTSTSTNGAGVLPLQIFITETLRRSKTSYSTLQVALYYLILLKQCLPSPQGDQSRQSGCRAMQCGRRMFLTALILASKYLQDRNYSARAWSKISGLPLKEINENERRYLGMICWDLHVPKETFENWSKIVLAICRLSSDGDVPGRDSNHRPPGPSTGLAYLKQTHLQTMCGDSTASRTWWLNNLRCLSLGMVQCPRKTENFLSTVSPFKPNSALSPHFLFDPVPRVYSPDYSSSQEDSAATPKPKCLPKLPSLERISQSFQSLERSASPVSQYKVPPQPMLRNLPTPQTTPRPESTNMWSGLCRQSLRCKASASALSSLDRNIVPSANMESCPPPRPRHFDRNQSSGLAPWVNNFKQWLPSKESTPSLTSSPESVVSDISSISARSRSSSISSTSSWMPALVGASMQDPDYSFKREVVGLQQKLAAERIPLHVRGTTPHRARPCLTRCQTAVKLSAPEDERFSGADDTTLSKLKHSQSMHFVNESHGNEGADISDWESRRKAEAAQALLAFQSMASTPSNTSESDLQRPSTVAGEHALHRKPSQFLKRARSDSCDIVQLDTRLALLGGQQAWQVPQDFWLSQYTEFENAKETSEKQTQLPSQIWATPRKPIQCGVQNKRMAMQTPEQASNVAANYLRRELLVG